MGMNVRLRARFDGQVLVPEEPIELPMDQTLTVHVELPTAPGTAARLDALDRLLHRAVDAALPADALTRESIYEDGL